ncbi:MAG: class I SAM-dependent methyltransferase, partial [Acidobacteria bacterium]|nr:class I SAM-dependent methyltransferase [Acidobacteriota bacterium]
AGARLARDRGALNLHFARADGQRLPFRDRSFDLVLSHAVIEHVPDAALYLRECARVLKRDGHIYLSTAPYLSFAGAHLPRLRIPIPLHLLLGRRVAFATFRGLARHATWMLREPADENSFIKAALRDECKMDDLLEKVRVRRLRRHITAAGLTATFEALHLTQTFKRLPAPLRAWVRNSPWAQDVAVSNLEYVLRRSSAAHPRDRANSTTVASNG